MLAFSLLFLEYACAQTSIRIRYFSPILLPLVVLAMLGLNAAYMVDLFKKDRPLEYLTGKMTREEYIQSFRQEYAGFHYANDHLAPDAKIFGLFMGGRGYYSDRHIAFPDTLLYKAARDAASGRDVAATLTGKGFTHILMNYAGCNVWIKEAASDHNRQVLRPFFEVHTRVLFSSDGYGLLQIDP